MSNYRDIKYLETSQTPQNAFRNIIINGDMHVSQRGTSEADIEDNGFYTVDRFETVVSEIGFSTHLGTWTQSQSTDVPSGQGFTKSFKLECTTANASPSTGNVLFISQQIEGQNLQYLNYGTSSAKSLTLSFWVKCNKTGTARVNLNNKDSSRNNGKNYTINTADTWEKKTITFAGDTEDDFNNDNGASLDVQFWLDAGPNYKTGTTPSEWDDESNSEKFVGGTLALADSTNNEFYITGVQLEVGTTASDFEFLPYDVSFQRCLRYYYIYVSGQNKQFGNAVAYSNTYLNGCVQLQTSMRVTPSIVQTGGSDFYKVYGNGTSDAFTGVSLTESSPNLVGIRVATGFSGTQGYAYYYITNNSSCEIAFDAEITYK